MRFILILVLCFFHSSIYAQNIGNNFRDRKAIIINNAPFLELADFSFSNQYQDRRTRLITELSWTNKGQVDITAFEVVVLRYDPFNRPLRSGGAWMVKGIDSANWAPLASGMKGSDGLIAFSDEPVFTSIVYVRAARFANGTVWNFNPSDVQKRIQASLPEIKEFQDLNNVGLDKNKDN